MTHPPGNATHPLSAQAARDRRWVLLVSLMFMIVTLLPYLYGASLATGRQFMWLGYNLDDSCAYLASMRQAADGALLGFNLFTTDPQHGMAINPLFLLLGILAKVTHLPLIAVYHISRLVLGVQLLRSVWSLICELLPSTDSVGPASAAVSDGEENATCARSTNSISHNLTRRLAFLLVCFSSGLGWLPLWWQDNPINTPIDKWQPEAITFLSLFLSPLFCLSLTLQVQIVLLLFRADRTGLRRPVFLAGLCGFVLALVHTYDVVSLTAVWATYLLLKTMRPLDQQDRQTTARSWLNAVLAGAMTLPGVAYIYLQLRTETVFKERAAVATSTPGLIWILTGYGLTLMLALITVYRCTRVRKPALPARVEGSADTGSSGTVGAIACRLLIAWTIANLAVAYLPTSIQRKLLQGEHFPIALLAGVGAAWLLGRCRLNGWPLRGVIVVLVLLLGITNIRFMFRDMENYQMNLAQTRQHRTYLKPGEIDALRWIDANVPRTEAVQPLPYLTRDTSDPEHVKYGASDMTVAVFTPAWTNHHVYCGHWGETPNYLKKLQELEKFALPKTTDEQRIAQLRKMKVNYLIYSQKDVSDEAADHLAPMFRGLIEVPPYLKRVYSNSDADVYAIDLSTTGAAGK